MPIAQANTTERQDANHNWHDSVAGAVLQDRLIGRQNRCRVCAKPQIVHATQKQSDGRFQVEHVIRQPGQYIEIHLISRNPHVLD
jgi:hypothetical protein